MLGKRSSEVENLTSYSPESRALDSFCGHWATSPTISASPFERKLGSFSSIRARQIRFVDLNPAHPAAPVTMGRWLPRRYIVEGARGDNGSLAVARGMRNRTVTVAANLSREAFRLRKIKAFDQLCTLRPAKLSDWHRDIGRAHSAGGFATTGAVTVPEPSERRAHFVAN